MITLNVLVQVKPDSREETERSEKNLFSEFIREYSVT